MGQSHLLGADRPLTQAVRQGRMHSMVLQGPPGVGKTSLVGVLARALGAELSSLSAAHGSVRDLRAVVTRAAQASAPCLLFIDEIHRFNKAQQDALLPFVEDGTLTLMGATTENPSFEIRSALLSRLRVYRLHPLTGTELGQLLERGRRALSDDLATPLSITEAARQALILAADGDARRLLNMLEVAADFVAETGTLDARVLDHVLADEPRRFDKGGDLFYEQISALHKSVRGSSPDAALYWLARMLDGGADPLYIARRLLRMASEDVGNADPRALTLALDAWQVQERLGVPEGELALAQAVVYLACAPKSNAVYQALGRARKLVAKGGTQEVPMHLRNAPTGLMKDAGYGAQYKYAHDWPEAYVAGENYFPRALAAEQLYEPVARGLELRVRQKLAYLRQMDQGSHWRRYQQDADEPPS